MKLGVELRGWPALTSSPLLAAERGEVTAVLGRYNVLVATPAFVPMDARQLLRVADVLLRDLAAHADARRGEFQKLLKSLESWLLEVTEMVLRLGHLARVLSTGATVSDLTASFHAHRWDVPVVDERVAAEDTVPELARDLGLLRELCGTPVKIAKETGAVIDGAEDLGVVLGALRSFVESIGGWHGQLVACVHRSVDQLTSLDRCAAHLVSDVGKARAVLAGRDQELDRLPVVSPENRCAVCHQPFDGGEVRALVCGHDFHDDCVSRWLSTRGRCPLCRAQAGEDTEPHLPGRLAVDGEHVRSVFPPRRAGALYVGPGGAEGSRHQRRIRSAVGAHARALADGGDVEAAAAEVHAAVREHERVLGALADGTWTGWSEVIEAARQAVVVRTAQLMRAAEDTRLAESLTGVEDRFGCAGLAVRLDQVAGACTELAATYPQLLRHAANAARASAWLALLAEGGAALIAGVAGAAGTADGRFDEGLRAATAVVTGWLRALDRELAPWCAWATEVARAHAKVREAVRPRRSST
ncbi:RING finger domain-containing protein [Lentzea aerocolonigenes]|nr:RING finger domain-containing protein [Lentzea aerocolonigenes]